MFRGLEHELQWRLPGEVLWNAVGRRGGKRPHFLLDLEANAVPDGLVEFRIVMLDRDGQQGAASAVVTVIVFCTYACLPACSAVRA